MRGEKSENKACFYISLDKRHEIQRPKQQDDPPSLTFSNQLKKLIKTCKDGQFYLNELVKLEQQRIAHEIAKRRKEKHLSQSELAEKIGTTQAVVSRMEKGKVNVGLHLLIKLKATLGLSLL